MTPQDYRRYLPRHTFCVALLSLVAALPACPQRLRGELHLEVRDPKGASVAAGGDAGAFGIADFEMKFAAQALRAGGQRRDKREKCHTKRVARKIAAIVLGRHQIRLFDLRQAEKRLEVNSMSR